MATSPAAPSAAAAAVATTTETIVGSYVFRIDDFSGTKDLGVGKKIRSSTFRVGGHAWYIDCYPCGDEEEDATPWVTLSLHLDHPSPNDQGEAQCSFTLMGCAGGPFVDTLPSKNYTSAAADDDCFQANLIEREELESLLLNDDCFQVRCDVSIFNEFHAVPPPDLHRHLGDLLASSRVGGDVTFEVGGELFTAHRYILAARSSVFAAELFGPWKEGTAAARIRIDDMEPKVFRALLHFIYTDSVINVGEDDDDKVVLPQHLLVAADRYNLGRLKLICEEMLCNCIDETMAATTLLLASKHGCDRLKEACSTFLTDLLASVQGQPDQQSCHRTPSGKR